LRILGGRIYFSFGVLMSENKCWIAEMHRIVEERKGAVTEEDEQYIRNLMKIPNDDVSIEDVTFKNYHDYF
jgi:hypothetical protein